jgi:hypothetical protein
MLQRKSKLILCAINFSEGGVIYEIMREDILEQNRPQIPIPCIIRRMRFMCRITKATDTNGECVVLIAFTQQQLLHERTSVFAFIRTLPVLYEIISELCKK